MNYHFKNETQLIPILEEKKEEEIRIGFSRIEDYFEYRGLIEFQIKN